MAQYLELAKKFFLKLREWQRDASTRWRVNANRRTVLVLLLVGCAAAYLYLDVFAPPSDFPVGSLVTVSEGKSVSEIGYELKDQGVLRSPLAFRLLVKIFGREHGARAGDYLFKEPVTVWVVARAVSLGAFGLEPSRFRIPEGATTKEMAKIFDAELQRFDAEKFLIEAQPQEGYLFPDTYFFLPNTRESTVIQTMRQNFDDHMIPLEQDFASSSRSFDDIMKMASIIEREAFNAADRKMISGVLWNRIDRGMALQVDVTFLYTIGKNSFQLTKAELAEDEPYNTYVNKGLPPTPIGSPSLDSIRAALYPTKNSYLFYLADRKGTTYFSKTYEEHLRKKNLYLGT